jgi:hypothetical protein
LENSYNLENDTEILFKKGIEALKEKNFSLSIERFQNARAKGFTSDSLETALGRAFTENGQIAEGLYHLGLASYMSRADKEFVANLNFAQNRVENGWGTRMSHPAELFIKIETRVRSEEMFFLSSVFLFLFLVSLFYKGGEVFRKTRFFSLFFSIAILVLSMGTLAFSNSVAVATERTEVRGLPLLSEESKATIPEGTRFRVLRTRGDFLEIERPGQIRGWIEKRFAKIVPN